MSRLLMGFYGDDFTGSTDAMECLELNGVPAVLFLEPPEAGVLEGRFPQVRALGLAGVSRTMTPDEMDDELGPKFRFLASLRPEFVHYKVCSTFDSSPRIGSIGHAIDIGWTVFQPPVVPMMVGAPFLRRYVVFGNLFARVGETTYRLDRHPTMSRHPITPMGEADLRRHLAEQTAKRVGLVDILQLSRDEAGVDARWREVREEGHEVVLFDTLDEGQMLQIGRLVYRLRGEAPVFLVGSSGFEYALGMHLRAEGIVAEPAGFDSPGEASPLLVMSGSCAPGTAQQIDWALARGFAEVGLDTATLLDEGRTVAEQARATERTLKLLGEGRSVIVHSARGPDDPRIAATRAVVERAGVDPQQIGRRIGGLQGRMLRELLGRTPLRRVCVTGGDTCGHASRELGIIALRVVIPVAPGAPLCRASSHEARFEGLEISLKGGQNGADDYFGRILHGLRPGDPDPDFQEEP
jgi:uncharacterized protein YgbK (DUF1537 family)